MGGLRGQEILIILILLILVFGWKKLPDAARSLGRSARVFKSEVEEMKKDGKDNAGDGTVQSEASHQPVIPPPPAPSQQPPATGHQPPAEQPQHQQPQAQPQYQQPQRQDPPDDPTRPVA